MQTEFMFVESVTAPWVRPAVMSYKPFNADGSKSKTVTYGAWLMWHGPLNGGAR